MTERHSGYTVVLAHDIREDDAESTINAIRQIKGVLDVAPIVSGGDHWLCERRVRQELGEKLWGVLYPKAGEVSGG